MELNHRLHRLYERHAIIDHMDYRLRIMDHYQFASRPITWDQTVGACRFFVFSDSVSDDLFTSLNNLQINCCCWSTQIYIDPKLYPKNIQLQNRLLFPTTIWIIVT